MADLEERIERLERRVRDAAVFATAVTIGFILFLVYTWQTVPSRVADALNQSVIKQAEDQAVASAVKAGSAQRRAESAARSSEAELDRAKATADRVELVEGKP